MRSVKTLFLLVGLAISVSSFAQFSAGLEIASAMSNSSSIGTAGIGGSIRYEAPIKNKLSWTCSAGYLSFSNQGDIRFPTGNSIIAISNGVKYYLYEPGKGLYAAADIGLSGHRSIFSPGMGYRINRWDLTGRYNAIQDANYISLRVAYVFGLK